MEKSLQKKFRAETREYFLKVGWQQLFQASYSAREFDDMTEKVTAAIATIEANELEIRQIKARLDYHTVENRNRVKDLEAQTITLRETSRSLQPIMEGLNTEIQQFKHKGDRYLKMAEYCDAFALTEKK